MDKQRKSGISAFLYTIGTLLIAVFMVIVAINFAHDARVFQKPLLSTSDEKKSDTSNTDGYKTIKYKKPAADSTKQTEKANTAAKPASTAKPATKTPSPTVDP